MLLRGWLVIDFDKGLGLHVMSLLLDVPRAIRSEVLVETLLCFYIYLKRKRRGD